MRRIYRHPVLNPHGLPKFSWGYRVLQLRRALGWTKEKLSIVSGLVYSTIDTIERGVAKSPHFSSVYKIKRVELAYADILEAYKKEPIRLNRLRPRQVGNSKSSIRLQPISIRRPEDIESLEGVETNSGYNPIFFGKNSRKFRESSGWGPSQFRKRARMSAAATRMHREKAAKRRGENPENSEVQSGQPNDRSTGKR